MPIPIGGIQLKPLYVTGAKDYILQFGREKDVTFKQMPAIKVRKLIDETCPYCHDTLDGMTDSEKVLVSIVENSYHASARIRK